MSTNKISTPTPKMHLTSQADVSAMDSARPIARSPTLPTEPSSFMTLPAEIRLKIYALLFPELVMSTSLYNIHAGHGIYGIYGRYSPPSITPRLDIRLVCKEFFVQLNPLIVAAPVVICGSPSELRLPRRLLHTELYSRVHEVRLQQWQFACLSNRYHYFSTQWFFDLPNLRSVYVEPRGYELEFPIKLLSFIVQWLRDEHENHLPSIPLPDFIHSSTGIKREEAARTEEYINHRNVTLRGEYRFRVEARSSSRPQWETVLSEGFRTIVVWDKHSLRMEQLPDLREKSWWKEMWSAEESLDEGPRLTFSLKAYNETADI
ncbi:hypothetical protein H2200_002456 [Cladophialophora chaetospira]|uniref:Uncharacterized protein n=1 Tax=Cladophialophora chaetospira TaxID=386627 RepID=A0AA38XIW4_9EURO|nr:hypothetical protein H2200_002456 [Cladophialophora chaetospira]